MNHILDSDHIKDNDLKWRALSVHIIHFHDVTNDFCKNATGHILYLIILNCSENRIWVGS